GAPAGRPTGSTPMTRPPSRSRSPSPTSRPSLMPRRRCWCCKPVPDGAEGGDAPRGVTNPGGAGPAAARGRRLGRRGRPARPPAPPGGPVGRPGPPVTRVPPPGPGDAGARAAREAEARASPGLRLPLRTARLLLRDFVAADWAAVRAYASDPEVVRF